MQIHHGLIRVKDEELQRKLDEQRDLNREDATLLRATAVVVAKEIVELIRSNPGLSDDGRKELSQANFDQYWWQEGKEPELRKLPRFSFKNTRSMGKKNKKVGRLPSRKDSYKEEEGESIIEEEDISFIKAHSEQLKFLASMNSDALSSTNNTRKPKKDLDRVPTLKVKDRPNGSLKPQELSETEDEEDAESLGDSDAESSDLEVLSGSDPGEIYSDVDASGSEVSSDYNYHDNDDDKEEEEEEKEVEGEFKQDVYEMEDLTVDRPLLNRKERKLLKRKAQMAGLMEYETKARRFSEDQSDDDGMKLSKTRLPIKDLSGRLARVKDEEDEPRSEGNEANSNESEIEETDEDDEGEEEEEEEGEGMGSGSDQDREDGAEGSFNDKEILALKDLLNLPKKQYIV
ncbi:hypothetical protein EV182_004454, partial [Spiromyces aspiralis]